VSILGTVLVSVTSLLTCLALARASLVEPVLALLERATAARSPRALASLVASVLALPARAAVVTRREYYLGPTIDQLEHCR
jgi:hypothetical protein